MSSSKAGLRTAALIGLLLSGAAGSGCNQAITGAGEVSGSQPLLPPSPPPPLAIVPSTLELVVGQSAELGTNSGSASSFLWTSSDAAVALVSPGGTVIAVGTGTATITAGKGSDCAAISARPSAVQGAEGSGSGCAYATIFVLDPLDRGRR